MLYDPKWDGPSLAGLAAWLKTKNPDEKYGWWNSDCCAIAQYTTDAGKEAEWKNRRHFWGEIFKPYTASQKILQRMDELACDKPRTYGALLARVRAQSRVTIRFAPEHHPLPQVTVGPHGLWPALTVFTCQPAKESWCHNGAAAEKNGPRRHADA
jgi:hypothetical protein